MPTGYTNCVQDGSVTELKDYILGCSRAFGALIHMRDDYSNSEIKHREIDCYHLKQLNKAQSELQELEKLSEKEIQKIIDENHKQRLIEQQEGLKRFQEGRQTYLNMLEKVRVWQPPTEEHINLKNFAIQQLENSLSTDYSDNLLKYYSEILPKETIEEYKRIRLDNCLRDIEYHSKRYKEEIDGVEKINKWIDDLVNSFK